MRECKCDKQHSSSHAIKPQKSHITHFLLGLGGVFVEKGEEEQKKAGRGDTQGLSRVSRSLAAEPRFLLLPACCCSVSHN